MAFLRNPTPLFASKTQRPNQAPDISFPPMRTPMPRQSQLPPMPPMNRGLFDGLFDGSTGQGPMRPAPLPQQPRARAGGISDLLAGLQGGGNSSFYDQMAPPPSEAGPSPYADFQYLLDTPASERGYGFVPTTVDEGYGVDFGPIDPSEIDTRTPEEIASREALNRMAPMPSTPTGTIEQVISDGMPMEQDVYVMDPNLGNSPPANPFQANVDFMNNIAQENALEGGASPSYSFDPQTGQYAVDSSSYGLTGDAAITYYSPAEFESEFGRALGKMPSNQSADIQVPDMQARIDEMQARVAANQAAPAANPAMAMSPEELAALRERISGMNFGGFGGNFNIPAQAVVPEAAPKVTPESLMAQMPNNPFMGGFDREALMARIEAMQAQNGGNPVKMAGPRTISGGGSTVKTGATRPMMNRNPMFQGGR